MHRIENAIGSAIAVLLATCSAAALADDSAALDLQAEPAKAATPDEKSWHLFAEASAITAQQQAGGATENGHRLSLDLRLNQKLGPGLRLGFSSRLDNIDPPQAGQRRTRNQLREAYLNWQVDGGPTSLDIGRINLRHGPAYGYNPTDYLRFGATQSVVSADPVALRENRLGTFLLRGSRSWDGGGASIIWAPKLTNDRPSTQALTLNLGATNTQQRVMLTVNAKASERWSGELLALVQPGGHHRLGANFTGLLSDALVMHGEWSTSKSEGLLNQTLGRQSQPERIHQASLGVTWSAPTGTVITAEAAYNGGGLDRPGWQTVLAQSPAVVGGFFAATQADQELAARRAWLLYATHKGIAGVRQLDLTGFVRQNAIDHSHLAWVELRYHWPKFDAAVQWQRSSTKAQTEFGAIPYKQVVQLLGTVYF